ncbi:NADPH-dependent FMN reductase [Clostridium puniceum]|uniref:NADPH-dependent FMN reductase n=2 Tax=Clostridium puniceum TaxID=29367 RepID=A0A1S8T8I2_9CLOT|nr:NADPH-dependent FMN reductase [Clostridium puniceum]
MKKNILVLTGSPRKHGNSDMMADAFINGAKSMGHTVNKYEAAFTKISGCRACDTCWSKNVPCSFNDAFNEKFLPLLENADMLVLCMPLYLYGFPASIQATLEKTYSLLMPQSPVRMKISETALLICGGFDNLEVYGGAIETYNQLYKSFQWKNRGLVVALGVMEKGSIANTDYLEQAEIMGKNV